MIWKNCCLPSRVSALNSDLEKLLSAVKGGKLSQNEMQDIGNMLLKGLSPEQSEMLHRITSDPQQAQAFMNSPEVKKILDEQ